MSSEVDPVLLMGASRRMSLGEQLARAARKAPSQVAFRYEGDEVTFAEEDERVTRLARALSERGVGYGDRVAVVMLNRIEVIESYLAACRLGAIAVPVNFRLVAEEMAYVLEDSGARIMLCDADMARVAAAARARVAEPDGVPMGCVVVGDPGEWFWDAHGRRGEVEGYEDVIAASSSEPLLVDVPESAAAFIMYTSGTTGRPKGAVLSHYNLMINTFNMMSTMSMEPDDNVWLSGLPLFHIGCLDGFLPYLMVGGKSVILPSGQFDPVSAVDSLEREGATACLFVPAQWQAICSVPRVSERSFELKRILTGGSIAPPSVIRAMAGAFPGVPIYNGFGQTEMSSVTCVLRGEDAMRKIDSVGKPVMNLEVRIVDEEMVDVPTGEVGEIVYRGPTVMQGYWGKPEETRAAFSGGWFHSGDLCRMDGEGYVSVVDRKKDMIISGGENIYCAEVEAVIDSHAKVREVALIGVFHPQWGETPLAVVAPADPDDPPTHEEIISHCKDHLASYKKPAYVVVVDELPRNASGKVLKTILRERFGHPESLGLTESGHTESGHTESGHTESGHTSEAR